MLYCETKSTDVFDKKRESGDMINPDDQIYKNRTNGAHKFQKDYDTVVPTRSERFGTNSVRIFKDSGDTPKLAYEGILR